MKLKIPQYQLSEVLNMMAFKGISEADIKTMMDLRILREHYYRYNSTIFKAGEITEELGIVIKGRVIVENVDYWDELREIMDWSETHVTSTIFLCWAAQAALYHFYGLKKKQLPQKMFGLFWHRVMNRKIPLVRGFDDVFLAPHSRHTEVSVEDIRTVKEITILAESDEAGFFLGMADGGRKIFIMGHPEYDRVTLDGEYKRDLGKGMDTQMPKNYYENNDCNNKPLLLWRAHANNLYTNWLNYYVYQSTPFDLMGTPDFSSISVK